MAPFHSNEGSGSGEIWHNAQDATLGAVINMDLSLPNGFLIPYQCTTDKTLSCVKADLLNKAKDLPLYSSLISADDYIFYTYALGGEKEEFYDESRTIDSLRLFIPVLILVEPEGNREEKQLANDIGVALNHPLAELEHSLSLETEAVRMELFKVVEDCVSRRTNKETKLDPYSFPEDLRSYAYYRRLANAANESNPSKANSSPIGSSAITAPKSHTTTLSVFMKSVDGAGGEEAGQKLTIKIDVTKETPDDVIIAVLKSVHGKIVPSSILSSDNSSEKDDSTLLSTHSQYVLKIVGRRLYLTSAIPLCEFSYICSCLEKNEIPLLMLMAKDAVFKVAMQRWTLIQPSWFKARVFKTAEDESLKLAGGACLSHKEDMFKLRVLSASNLNVMDFDQDHIPLGWANMRLMDWRGQLVQGKQTLHLWPFPKDFAENLYPMGQNGSNTCDQETTIRLDFELPDYNETVLYPSQEDMRQIAAADKKFKLHKGDWDAFSANKTPPKDVLKMFECICRKGSQELSKQEQELLWQMREVCSFNYPEVLPLLCYSMVWSERQNIAHLYVLLDEWASISPDVALELLDVKYADNAVRSFAVKCLDESLCDDDLQLYIMFLVQSLKYEAFGTCALAQFLLRRALYSQRIGHLLFWLLRAELGFSHQLHARFALLMEALCRGVGPYLHCLLKQVDGVERLEQLSVQAKKTRDPRLLQKELVEHLDVVQYFESPLDPSNLLGELIIEKCSVIGSAKAPLRLTWRNPEALSNVPSNPTHEIIFKNGDDLRQDMFTLQVLKIMDTIWKAEGLDLGLDPYGCLPLGKEIGMIEVVKRAKTIFEIQCAEGGRSAVISTGDAFLNAWLARYNNGAKYFDAVDRFTNSCAAYSVATFVLGIKDRHQDNIMVTENGRIFHIDFGHFLGHYKKKLGICRERVPFILQDSFIYVINKGKSVRTDSRDFKQFHTLCDSAYMILHRHANLFVSLFTMMLCMGVPELQKLEDVEFLNHTLAVGSDDETALRYFKEQLSQAHGGRWTTNIDWNFHKLKHFKLFGAN